MANAVLDFLQTWKKWLLAGLVGTIGLVIILVIVFSGKDCQMVQKDYNFSQSESNPVWTEDGTAIVRMHGLWNTDNSDQFQLLKARRLEVSKKEGTTILTVHSSCSTDIIFNIERSSDDLYFFKSMEVKQQKKPVQVLTDDEVTRRSLQLDTKHIECSMYGVAPGLHHMWLEIELDGVVSVIKDGKFSKPSEICGPIPKRVVLTETNSTKRSQ